MLLFLKFFKAKLKAMRTIHSTSRLLTLAPEYHESYQVIRVGGCPNQELISAISYPPYSARSSSHSHQTTNKGL